MEIFLHASAKHSFIKIKIKIAKNNESLVSTINILKFLGIL